jgi:hypothetical protein
MYQRQERPQIYWAVGSWSECSKKCGGGTQRRLVQCHGHNRVLSNEYCKWLEKEPDSRDCNTKVRSFKFKISEVYSLVWNGERLNGNRARYHVVLDRYNDVKLFVLLLIVIFREILLLKLQTLTAIQLKNLKQRETAIFVRVLKNHRLCMADGHQVLGLPVQFLVELDIEDEQYFVVSLLATKAKNHPNLSTVI